MSDDPISAREPSRSVATSPIPQSTEDGTRTERTVQLTGWALAVAFIVLLAFAALVWWMTTQTGAGETKWTRLAWVFTSVEAIAFGAAGALFGSSIQRQRAENAEQTAKENVDAAAKGRALAEAIKAEDTALQGGDAGLESIEPGPPGIAASSVAARHATLARQLFP